MISKFFIHRPIFATVISIVIVLAGLMSLQKLPVAQYPDIVPPEVTVTAVYPGASAEVISETVAAPIEQEINGVDNMIYLSSTASDSGTLSINVTFELGTDPDQATINVNNRVQAALPRLPEEVRRQGVRVEKRSSAILQVVTLYSTDGSLDPIYLSNYALLNVVDELKRTPGVGDAGAFSSQDYSMRIWLRPDKLAEYDLTPGDVATAIREQNAQFAAGKFAAEPDPMSQGMTYTVTTKGRLVDAEEFSRIILRGDAEGSVLRLGDVARVELGAQDYSFAANLNGRPASTFGIYLQPGANALDTAEAVKATMERLKENFPEGMDYAIPFDTTRFVEVAVDEVIHTFVEAIILVILVVFLFLQNWRATIIPLIAVPVSLIGTLAGMLLLGFSINLLTLFGMVLAIGIVVDDAIVVLENVERIMSTEHIGPKEAAVKAMQEVTGPVIAIVLVLCAVFVPVAFLGGLSGVMYQQFAITIAISVVISGIVALTLTPALCGILLKPDHSEPWLPFRMFNRFFDRITGGYTSGVRFFLKRVFLGLLVFAGLIAATGWLWQQVPGALVPEEDQGYVFGFTNLMPGSSLDKTLEVTEPYSDDLYNHPAVENVITLTGFDLLSSSRKTSSAVSFITLKDWDERAAPELQAQQVAGAASGMGAKYQDAIIFSFNAPPITGLSSTGGFESYIQDRSGGDQQQLNAKVQEFVAAANARPELAGVRTTLNVSVPRYRVEVDQEKARSMGVDAAQVYETMQSTFGSLYVNDFTLFGRNYQVTLQSEAEYRRSPSDLRKVFVRAQDGTMVPISSLLTFDRTVGPEIVERFNVFPAAKVQGQPAPGFSSGQALTAMEEVAAQVLGEDYSLAWTGASYQEKQTGGAQSLLIFGFGILMVFLILSAQYERWSLPFAVITAVPFAAFGAVLAVFLRGLSNDIYFQIGLLVLTGLAAKNAILIVEFAVMKRQEGLSRFDAALEAAKLRFRPIVMTSLAFILGCVPLALSSGAGAASRHSIGTGVIGGMLAATFIAIFFVPMFYRMIDRTGSKDKQPR
ncbi:MAG: putative RND-type multidrug efflux pump membrane protein [Puniceicoccaceae bacterium 5H]|nr:MAG: putative RND-type multidrug efflux pump membrane protein [Puniceicoccaceae bacterium 5H]